MGGEGGVGGGVVEVVGHVGEEGAVGFEELYEGYGFVEVGVAGVGLAAEGVEDEDVEVLEEGDGCGGEVGEVGEVGGGAEAEAGDGLATVGDGDALEGGAEERNRARGGREDVDVDAGGGGVTIDVAEGVGEDAAEDFGGGLVGVEGDAGGGAEAQGAEVVHAEDVVGVVVGVEDGVDLADGLADGLGVEVGAGVDEDGVAGCSRGGWRGGCGDFLSWEGGRQCRRRRCIREWELPWRCRCRGMSELLALGCFAAPKDMFPQLIAIQLTAISLRLQRTICGPEGGGVVARCWAERARAWVTSRKARRSSKRALESMAASDSVRFF